MNETLYHWTFKFHTVVRQQNSGAVEDFMLPYSAVYLWIQKWKNYWNRSTFAKVIVKIKVARFSMAHGVQHCHNHAETEWRPRSTRARQQWDAVDYCVPHLNTQLQRLFSIHLYIYTCIKKSSAHQQTVRNPRTFTLSTTTWVPKSFPAWPLYQKQPNKVAIRCSSRLSWYAK